MHKYQVNNEKIKVTTKDGVVLVATMYTPEAPSKIKAGVLISSGTGYPKEFYARFAAYGASRGFACMIYDYRGIAASEPDNMRACTADFFTWGTLDATAALDVLANKLDGQPIFTLGHSFGGQLIGLMDNHHLAIGHAFIAVGNGYWLGHRPSEWLLEFLFFFILGPLSLARHGYLKGPEFWPGSNMPGPVFKQWRRWCLTSDYYWPEIQERLDGGHFNMNGAAIRQFVSTDDPVVTPRSEAFINKCYASAQYETSRINPADLGVKTIGHSGMFARSGSQFWPMPFDWFETLI